MPIRYLDHAATSWPKPEGVVEAMAASITHAGGNPGRGAHALSLAAARTVAHARGVLASFLGVRDERDLIFTAGCTAALNLVLKGSLRPGDRVVVSSVEHNAVVRPLNALAGLGVDVVRVLADAEGVIDADDVEAAVAERPTRMVVCQHASNVTGAIQPVADLADIAHEHGALMVVDGAQAAGHMQLDLVSLGVDAYAMSGHKGLLGPQGVGALYLAASFEPDELIQGGSGGRSEDAAQPRVRPDRYEAGTCNAPGIAGLGAAAGYLAAHSAEVRHNEHALVRRLHEGLLEISGITVLGPPIDVPRVPVVSVVHARLAPDEMAFALDRRFRIAARGGLHCSPWTHETIGTLQTGALRFGLGWSLTVDDVDAALDAMRTICA